MQETSLAVIGLLQSIHLVILAIGVGDYASYS